MDPTDVRGLLSLLLADGSLAYYPAPTGGYVQMVLTAGREESEFLEEKRDEIRRFLPTKAQIVPYITHRNRDGSMTESLRLRVTSKKLRPIYNLLYPNRGGRVITDAALELLGGRAAAWLWAEGCRPQVGGHCELARVGGSRDEAQRIGAWLSRMTGASFALTESRVKPRLRIDPQSVDLIRRALLPYAPASRRHLFDSHYEHVQHPRLRRLRAELQPRGRDPLAAGIQVQALAGDPAS